MKGSLLPLLSGKYTQTKGTAIKLHRIHCELKTFKRNKNKHILRTNWCEIHSSDLWHFRWSETLWLSRIWFIHEAPKCYWLEIRLGCGFYSTLCEGKRKNSWSWREIAQTVKGICRPTWQPRGRYTRGRKWVNPLAGSRCGIVQTGKDDQEPDGLH